MVNRPTRVLVTGAAGQVGVDLVDTLHGVVPLGADPEFEPDGQRVSADEFEVLGISHRDLDLTNRDATERAVRLTRPDVIVHLAAYTQVDRAETEVELCYAVNAGATETLSLVAHDLGAHLIAISTDFVFDGAKGSAYVEDDTTNPPNVYGASKRAGELMCSSDDTVVRTSWVMGVRGKNVVHAIADRAKSGETVRFVNDQMGTVTLASDLARALATMVRARPGGVWHVANSGATTWFDIAAYAGSVLGREDDFVQPIATSDLQPPPLATRPSRSDLAIDKWVAAGWRALPEWRDGLARLLRDRDLREETP
jgi:dTDP-4-dehydrorhamnose reductase